jgi:hypothetical protein
MANFLPFLSKKPFAHIPLDYYFLAAMWNFAKKNTCWNMYIYIPIRKEVGVWNQEFNFSSLSQEEWAKFG